MKKLNYLLPLVCFTLFMISCSNDAENKNSKEEISNSISITNEEAVNKVATANLVYFHFTKRCATCNAIEEISNEVAGKYDEKVGFASYNLEEPKGEEMGKKLGADGQTLVLVYGDDQIDLTEDAFLNALSDPEKLKQIINEKIKSVLM
jgi:thiol-disulfide isomerase/thioredoxin